MTEVPDKIEGPTAPPPPTDTPGRFSCVVDEDPRFHLDALRWFSCLTEVAGVQSSDLVVHTVGSTGSDVLSYLSAQGVTVKAVGRFDPRSPHCNKIAGALHLAERGDGGTVVLCDTDLAVLEDPRQLELPAGAVAGKTVDAPVPPLDVIRGIFDTAGLTPPASVRLPWGADDWTVAGNFNGGLYLVPGPLLPTVTRAWAHWARWLLDRRALLLEWDVYVDQVAMALGLAAESIDAVPLDVRWNTPVHDPTRIASDAQPPSIIHYHQELSDDGLLQLTGVPGIDDRIGSANAAITTTWSRATPEQSHRRWLERSGRAVAIADPERQYETIIAGPIAALAPASTVAVGALEHRLLAGIPLGGFTAIDTLDGDPVPAELIICLDEPLWRSGDGSGEMRLRQLWDSAGRALLVDGSAATAESLGRVAPEAEVYPLGGAGALLLALRPPRDRHPRDYGPATLDLLKARHPDPAGLIAIRLHAWASLRFYPDHAPRLWEYPAVARLILDGLPAGSRLVDVGAGTTPLAPFLTSQGYVVDTVDPSSDRRQWPPGDDWNEWGFLDYGRAGLAHNSWNTTVDKLPRHLVFDGAYSISVIEHVPASDRRAMLAELASRVRPGGLVLLTIDLMRGGNRLWNRNLGVDVEDPAVHGTFQDVVDEGASVGLELLSQETVRDWGDVDVDIGLLAMRQRRPLPPRGLSWARVRSKATNLVRRPTRRAGGVSPGPTS